MVAKLDKTHPRYQDMRRAIGDVAHHRRSPSTRPPASLKRRWRHDPAIGDMVGHVRQLRTTKNRQRKRSPCGYSVRLSRH